MIFSRNELKRLNNLEKVLSFPSCKSLLRFYLFSSYCSLSKSPSRSSVLRLYPENPKNIEGNFFTTHSPCWQRRKSFSTDRPSVHTDDLPTHSIGMEECKGYLQATRVGVFSFVSPHWNQYNLLYREYFT